MPVANRIPLVQAAGTVREIAAGDTLYVAGSMACTSFLQAYPASTGGVDLFLTGVGSGSNYPTATLSRHGGSVASPTAVANGNTVGVYKLGGYDGSAYSFATFAGVVAGSVSSGSVPIDVVISTGTGATPTERVRVSSAGLTTFTAPAGGGETVKVTGANSAYHSWQIATNGATTYWQRGEQGAGSAGAAYYVLDGYQESWFNVVTRSNTSGKRWLRFGNLSDAFRLDLLNDAGSAITTTGILNVSASAPANSLSINASGTLSVVGAITPASLADASAPNNSVYYSTTQSRLVYKNSAGTVNNLY